MNKNELKKQLMLQKTMAEFGHYCAGNLYYRVKYDGDLYRFPIATVEPAYGDGNNIDVEVEMSAVLTGRNKADVRLSADLGTTPFHAQERASMLWRWIDKAIDAGEFVKLDIVP